MDKICPFSLGDSVRSRSRRHVFANERFWSRRVAPLFMAVEYTPGNRPSRMHESASGERDSGIKRGEYKKENKKRRREKEWINKMKLSKYRKGFVQPAVRREAGRDGPPALGWVPWLVVYFLDGHLGHRCWQSPSSISRFLDERTRRRTAEGSRTSWKERPQPRHDKILWDKNLHLSGENEDTRSSAFRTKDTINLIW